MSISSRTPEGTPGRCPLCGAELAVDYAAPAGDAVCPQCGCLVWVAEQRWLALRNRISELWGVSPELITPEMQVADLLGKPAAAVDSLDAVELVMMLEEEFDLDIPDDAAAQVLTIGDALKYLLERLRERGAPGG
jgi:acyl carrier protein